MKIRFRLRTMLILMFVLSTLLAWAAYLQQRGRTQIDATMSLKELGATSYERNEHVSFREYSFSGGGAQSVKILLPEVTNTNASGRRDWLPSYFGNAMFVDYSTLVIGNLDRESLEAICSQIDKLPGLETIYVCGDVEIGVLNDFSSRCPDIDCNRLDGYLNMPVLKPTPVTLQ